MADQASWLRSLRDVASRISSDADLDALLRDLIRSACEHGAWDLGSIMAVDAAGGYAHVMARHDSALLRRRLEDRWALATSPALVALRRGEPVYIRDARESEAFPGYRREAFERDYRTVLVIPMACTDAEGHPLVLVVVSRAVREVSGDDLAFMGMIVHLGAIAIERGHRHRAQAAAAEQLRRALLAQGSLLREVLAGGSTAALAGRLSDLLKAPVLVVDFFASSLLATGSPVPEAYDDDAWRRALDGPLGRRILREVRGAVAQPHGGTVALRLTDGPAPPLSARVEALMVDSDAVGALLTFGGEEAGDLRNLMRDSAKLALGVQMMRSVLRFRFETRTLTELFFEIVERRWRDPEDVADRARRLGLSLATPARMLVVDFPEQASRPPARPADHAVDGHHAVALLARQLGLPAHVVAIGGGLVCLLPQEGEGRPPPEEEGHLPEEGRRRSLAEDRPRSPREGRRRPPQEGRRRPPQEGGREPERIARFARRVAETLRHSFDREPIVVLGGDCEGLDAYAREWERCWRMIRIARAFGRSGALSAPDFGPLPMLIGAADSADVRRFIDGAIGRVVAHDRDNGTPYLETLAAYLRAGCRSQPCADAMGLHVTTLRYRLSRIGDLFGIDVDTPERRFAVELALQLHGLIENSLPSPG
ncbi:hypothetical protein OPKNFCMD_2075 [Methylobacterium crusticola]|uniref:GAF domain-containing protein n=1 Tax=Methylobacterium crusticola TaxID=1697972 RepID=A0ABQ4QX86_9HYPH|nr:helix-turn-helix domain-containing protein [Methylobacterium crusticola]GJD49345.1 hypothetical protein OPKNFCMD_2075 [Methylobacterium crusticola]